MPDDSDETGLSYADRLRSARSFVASAVKVMDRVQPNAHARNAVRRLDIALVELNAACIESGVSAMDAVAGVMPE